MPTTEKVKTMPELEPPMPTPDTMPDAALEAFHALTRDRSRGGNPHPPMLKNRYVSGSQTVKLTCQHLAALIAGTEKDDGDPHWGENGNALADINLARVPYGENEAAVGIAGTEDESEKPWLFIIHADGLTLTNRDGHIYRPPGPNGSLLDDYLFHGQPWWLGIHEHKAPIVPYDDDAYDIARRQAYAVMGAIMACHEAGASSLPPAFYIAKDDPRHRDFPLPEQLFAGAVNLICAPYSAEREERLERITAQVARQELDRCLAKARAAIWTAIGKDPNAAAKWDAEHPEEFLWRMTEKVPATRDEATKEIARLCAAHRLMQPVPDTTKAAREKARDRVKALVAKHGLPAELDFDTGVGYRLNAKGAFSSVGTPDPSVVEDAAALAVQLTPKAVA